MSAAAEEPTLSWVAVFNRSTQRSSPLPSGAIRTRAEAGAYATRAFDDEVAIMSSWPQGSRNARLNIAAFNLGQLVGADLLDEDDVRDGLVRAGLASGLEPGEVAKTTASGIRAGKQSPRQVAPATVVSPLVRDVDATSLLASQPSGEAAGPGELDDEAEVREATTWRPAELPERAAADDAEPEPTHLVRSDGARLLYSGKVNGLLGESESGKSWLALLAVVQAVSEGQRVLVLDFEDAPGSIMRRLVSMGLGPLQLRAVHYANPSEALHLAASADLAEAIAALEPGLIVLDGVNAAMTLLGYDLLDNTDATKFSQGLLRPLASSGACVLTVDHVPKDTEKRGKGGIGAQAKRAMCDGTSIRVEVLEPFGKGQAGTLKLTVDKDRSGRVRGVCLGGSAAGRAHLVSIADTVELTVVPAGGDVEAGGDEPSWAPTALMEKISRLLEVSDPLSRTMIEEDPSVRGRTGYKRTALATLVELGFVATSPGIRNAVLHRSLRPFREGDSLTPSDPVPTPSGRGHAATPSVPSPPKGTDGVSDGVKGGLEDGGRGRGQDPDFSDCNRCGLLTAGWIIRRTGGYCSPCNKVVNR